jgi:adenine-specific DNA methylase
MQRTTTTLTPLALKDAPALIETVFPAQKVSFEAQAERKAVAAQTLTGLGSYWKGRKPLILVRAIVLGCLLPATDDPEQDLAVFEKLMAFDEESLARRALAENALSATRLQELIPISDPENYFSGRGWRRDITDDDKLVLYRRALVTFGSYEEKASLGKRPEEVDQEWLYAKAWKSINQHYAHLGINANNIAQLVEQLGMLRYGHRPRTGDTFSGGGSIPFEAARIGCDTYASDLNPIACMLTWGALNIIGANPERRAEIDRDQQAVFDVIDKEITKLGVEHDEKGNRAKAYLYCLETRCPETGWMIPLSPSWMISPKQRAVAMLIPDEKNKRFDIEVVTGASAKQIAAAEKGTVQDGNMVYTLNGRTYRSPIKTLRGDFRDVDGNTGNRLRRWEKDEFHPRPDDIFQERLYAIQWITKKSINESRQVTYFATVTEADLVRERQVEKLVSQNLAQWQAEGLVPDMAIEPGEETTRLGRERGWTYWHHLFNPRQLLLLAIVSIATRKSQFPTFGYLNLAKAADFDSKLCRWLIHQGGGLGGPTTTFYNQALNTLFNYASRGWYGFGKSSFKISEAKLSKVSSIVLSSTASEPLSDCDLWITDPPYADAVHYHEITEFFIAWLRKNPPIPFDDWVWDSRRALAVKGVGENFRKGMVAAYRAMAEHMPGNGMQCVMFTHQDTDIWSDMVSIFWAAGLQVVAAWYLATEKTDGIKKGAYVQGTVTMLLRKRSIAERIGFKQRILPAVRNEVQHQIEVMMHLNDKVKCMHGEAVFNDSDLQMAGYAAALKVLTGYTQIGDEDVTTYALRPRVRGEVTVIDEIVQQAAETANSLLVPEGLAADTWAKLTGIERFMLRMMDMESTGAAKLDNYQNFAKVFRVENYSRVMGSMVANQARLKHVPEFASRDLTDSTELGATRLGRLIVGVQQILCETEPQAIVSQLQAEMADFLEVRSLLVDLLAFIERKAPEEQVRAGAEVLGSRLKNLRFGA